MKEYRKKPVVIEAIQLNTADDFKKAKEWSGAEEDTEIKNCSQAYPEGFDYPCLQIKTLEGTMTASIGDWIIKGVSGEFYPCKPDIFEKTYEPAE